MHVFLTIIRMDDSGSPDRPIGGYFWLHAHVVHFDASLYLPE
jgi:hypothetical protein